MFFSLVVNARMNYESVDFHKKKKKIKSIFILRINFVWYVSNCITIQNSREKNYTILTS